MLPPPDHPTIPPRKVGVLLTNLGTPDAPDAGAVRRYLAEFLSDPRVIEIPRAIWKPILHGIVLRTRPAKSAHAYSQVWTEQGSPLAAITRRQARKLQERFGDSVMVDWAMRYGNPSIPDRLTAMKEAGCERILVAPLYPQYCAATTATANDLAFLTLAGMRWQPALRTLPPYHDSDDYIAALQNDLEAQIGALDFEPQRLLLSYHGMPERTLQKGDPYHCHCQKTTRLLGEALGLGPESLLTTFQSRFGRAEWLKPYTAETVAELARTGTRSLVVITPGFASDCVETLEEIAIGVGELFHASGGKNFSVVPCLNDSPESIDLLATLIRQELAGWA